jgi:bifunctional non-homologous end joining protein LigD
MKSESTSSLVTIEDRTLKLTNLHKVLYPAAGFTKGQVIDYYVKIGKYILPHLKNRPLTLKRYPGGVDDNFFYEKECPAFHPDWIDTVPVPSNRRKFVNFCLVNDLPSLIWVVNLASIEMHTSLSLANDILTPKMLVFDLDPGEPATLLQCLEVAIRLKYIFDDLGIESFPKTSGGKGLHIYVPLNTPVTYDHTKTFARAVAQLLEKRMPNLVTSNMRKDLRIGKVFVDWSQNDDHKTTVCVYSMRAREEPTVSAPISWDRIFDAQKKKDTDGLVMTWKQVLDQVESEGDLFEPIISMEQFLPAL